MGMKLPSVFSVTLLALIVLISDHDALARELDEKPQFQAEMNNQARPQDYGGYGPGYGGYGPGYGGRRGYGPGYGGGYGPGFGRGYGPGYGPGYGGCYYRCGYYRHCCSAAEYHADQLASANGDGN